MELNFLPRFSKCCCCISLRIGSLIIGYVSLISSAFSMSAVSWSLYRVVTFVQSKTNETTSNPEHTPEEVATLTLSLYISHAYFLFVLLYYFAISLLLIVGVHMNRTKYMRYYFNAALLLLVLALALIVVTCVFFGVLATIPLLKWSIILFYFLTVVRSTYLELEEQNKPRVYEMQNLYSPVPAPLIT